MPSLTKRKRSRSARLHERIKALKDELDATQGEADLAFNEAQTFERLAHEASWDADQLRAHREFIADVQRGIRDLSEYEDVCGP